MNSVVYKLEDFRAAMATTGTIDELLGAAIAEIERLHVALHEEARCICCDWVLNINGMDVAECDAAKLAHIEVCEKHPLAKALRENERLGALVNSLEEELRALRAESHIRAEAANAAGLEP